MAAFKVNGKNVCSEKNQKLLRFLRDELRLTSVKDGCSEGACGACTVIIDGKTCKACVPDTDSLSGREIITVEGLTEWERQVYTYAYGKAGAVQCGFCIPGMVMCTKALLDENMEPTDDEIRYALRNNYCRCTGYVKIMDAVRLAAKILKKGEIPDDGDPNWTIGNRVARIDVAEKVLGTGKYPDDFYLDGMLYGSALRSRYARARVLSIDTSKAKELPGVEAVVTAADIPGENKIGHLKHDQYTLIPVGGLVHYLGDAVALVAAKDRETVEKAKKLIKVDYEVLPHVHTIEEAAAPDAPKVFDEEAQQCLCTQAHQQGKCRGSDPKFQICDLASFRDAVDRACVSLSRNVPLLFMMRTGTYLSIPQTSQRTRHRHECSLLLGTDKVKVQNALVGGGFGGKEDMTVQHLAALLTYVTKKPVKVKLTRAESLLIHPKRHPFYMDMTMGCDEEGNIMGVKAIVYFRYRSFRVTWWCRYWNVPVPMRQDHIIMKILISKGLHIIPIIHRPERFRGFGVTQTCFATETLLNMMADKVGITPWEIRYRNAIRPGEVLPNGQIVDASTGLVETLEAVKEDYDAAMAAGKPVGIGCAMKNAGVRSWNSGYRTR